MVLRNSFFALSVLAACVGNAAGAGAKSGEQVYQEVCAACHLAGVEKAPRFGDRKAWAALIKEGQVPLTVDGWIGVRGMPARGGRNDLSLEEFARATAHMARAAGANWQDPDTKTLERMRALLKRREAQKAPR